MKKLKKSGKFPKAFPHVVATPKLRDITEKKKCTWILVNVISFLTFQWYPLADYWG